MRLPSPVPAAQGRPSTLPPHRPGLGRQASHLLRRRGPRPAATPGQQQQAQEERAAAVASGPRRPDPDPRPASSSSRTPAAQAQQAQPDPDTLPSTSSWTPAPATFPAAVALFTAHPTPRLVTGLLLTGALARAWLAAGGLHPLTPADAAAAVAGAAGWVLAEPGLHALLHLPGWAGADTHAAHHAAPYHHVSIDPPALVLSWMAAVAGLTGVAVWSGAAPPGPALCGFLAYCAAGLGYEAVHFSAHCSYAPSTAWGRRLKAHHARHHLASSERWLAFQAPFLDGELGLEPDTQLVHEMRAIAAPRRLPALSTRWGHGPTSRASRPRPRPPSAQLVHEMRAIAALHRLPALSTRWHGPTAHASRPRPRPPSAALLPPGSTAVDAAYLGLSASAVVASGLPLLTTPKLNLATADATRRTPRPAFILLSIISFLPLINFAAFALLGVTEGLKPRHMAAAVLYALPLLAVAVGGGETLALEATALCALQFQVERLALAAAEDAARAAAEEEEAREESSDDSLALTSLEAAAGEELAAFDARLGARLARGHRLRALAVEAGVPRARSGRVADVAAGLEAAVMGVDADANAPVREALIGEAQAALQRAEGGKGGRRKRRGEGQVE